MNLEFTAEKHIEIKMYIKIPNEILNISESEIREHENTRQNLSSTTKVG